MKTAISLPDDLFEAVERLVRRTNRHRSEVYAEALREYVARHAPDDVTASLNAVMDDLGEDAVDRFVTEAGRRTLLSTEW